MPRIKIFDKRWGVHPPECKITAGMPIQTLPTPKVATLLLSQHIGAPAKPVVAKGDHVERGALVAELGGNLSACVHTPVSGTVTKIDKVKTYRGTYADAIVIQADQEQNSWVPEYPLTMERMDTVLPGEIRDWVANKGIVGLGGATFPTRLKLVPKGDIHADVLVVNGAECEPFLTADHALMLQSPDEIMQGTLLVMRAALVSKAYIAIEENKPDAIKIMRQKARQYSGIEIFPLKVKYPQGSEKQLIKTVTGREVPTGGLPIDARVIVQNVGTIYAVHQAVQKGKPLIKRVVTVTGPSLTNPGNFSVSIGTPLSELIEAVGGLPEDTGKVIAGGPMMGFAVSTLDAPTTKGLSGLLVLPRQLASRREPQSCIRCAECVRVCPMGLEPFLISTLSRLGRYADAKAEFAMNCIECGSCSYICPSARPILDYIRAGKGAIRLQKI